MKHYFGGNIMSEEKNSSGPVKKVKVGAVEVAVWENSSKEGKKFFTTTMERNYKTGEEWKKTNSLRMDDLPKAILALQEAYHFVAIKEQ
jgi:hypothetical protein